MSRAYVVFRLDADQRLARVQGPRGVANPMAVNQGVPLAADWPASAHFEMRKDPRHARPLDTVTQGPVVISGRLRAFLESRGVSRVEYLPVKVAVEKKPPFAVDYFVLNPLAVVDCLDLEASEAELAADTGQVESCSGLLLKEGTIPGGLRVFRARHLVQEVFMELELAEDILREGFVGPGFYFPRGYNGFVFKHSLKLKAPPGARTLPPLVDAAPAPPRALPSRPITVPAALQRFFTEKLGERLQGRYAAGLPRHAPASKVQVRFLEEVDFTPFTSLGLEPADHPTLLPFATLSRGQFLVVDAARESCPVRLFDPEDGKALEVADSLAGFLDGLLDRKDRTPIERMESLMSEAERHAAANPRKALDVLARVDLSRLPRVFERFEEGLPVSRYHHQRGLLRAATGDVDGALEDFRRAMALKDDHAALRLIDTLKDAGRQAQALEEATALLKRPLEASVRFHALHATGLLLLLLGRPSEAREAYAEILQRYPTQDRWLKSARDDLRTLAEKNPGVASGARELLALLG